MEGIQRLVAFVGAGWFVTQVFLGGAIAWAQDGVTAAGPELTASPPPPTLMQIIFSGGPLGVFIMLVLISMSLLATYLIFDHVLLLRRRELLPDGLGDEVRQLLLSGKLAEADQVCRERPSVLAFILVHGLAEVE